MGIVVLLTGCWDAEEVDDIFLPFAIAVDSYESVGDIKVSILAPSFSRKIQDEVVVLKGTGRSIIEAKQNMQIKVHKEINIGHVQVLLLSKQLAQEQRISPFLKSLSRNPRIKEYLNIFIMDGNAEEAFDLRLQSTPFPSEIMNTGAKLNYPDMRSPSRTLRTFLNDLKQEGIEPSIPYLELERAEGKPIGVIMEKIAVFQDDRIVGILGKRESMGYMVMMGAAKQKQITMDHVGFNEKDKEATPQGGFASFNIFRADSRIKPYILEDEPYFTVYVNVVGEITEHKPIVQAKLLEEGHIEMMEKEFAQEFKKLIEESLQQIQKEYESDIVGFGRTLRAYYPKYFSEEEWKKQFKDVKIKVKVNVKIRSIGVAL